MLEDLKILNGELSLKFNPLNTLYTVTLTNEEDTLLKFDYKTEANNQILVVGNNLKYGKNEVVLKVFNENEEMNYYFYVYKENTKTVNSNLNIFQEVDIKPKEEISTYVIPSISSICFLVILITFTLLFRKRKI